MILRRVFAFALFSAVICTAAQAAPGDVSPELYDAVCAATVPAPEPCINGPLVVGASPGKDFLHLVPATGEPPLRYEASGLPDGLTLDPVTGIIGGRASKAGKYAVTLRVTGPKGTAERGLALHIGERMLALTPPMGWNSWNIWSRQVDDAKIRAVADDLVRTGLAAHGFQYVNVDDCFIGGRDAGGKLVGNDRFPDMKALGDYIHARGLKFGVYTSPGPKTCAECEGSYGHEMEDAKTFAEWGADYLKHDWCSYTSLVTDPFDVETFKAPFRTMRAALDACGRDIVYSISQGGIAHVSHWGAQEGINLWRTSGDIKGSWDSIAGIGFVQDQFADQAGPGAWNDPDMLVIGKTKWDDLPALTQAEQLSHITLWCMCAAPLLLGCDLSRTDTFALGLVSNDEVLAVDQDPLGRAGKAVAKQGVWGIAGHRVPWGHVWARPLHDGGIAVALFNLADKTGRVTAEWRALGIQGRHAVRDLWLRRDIGVQEDGISVMLPPHGAALYKLRPVK